MRPTSFNDRSEDSEGGTLMHLKSGNDEFAVELHSTLGDIEFRTLSAVLRKELFGFKFLNGLGSGGFGSVFMSEFACDAEKHIFATKIEVLDSRHGPALHREACLYNEHSRLTRDDVPLPKLLNMISTRARGRNCWASIPLGSERTVNLMCIELLDTETPKAIWKEGAKQIADNFVVTASLRYLILEALHVLLFLIQKGIAHRDLKWPQHLGQQKAISRFRPRNG
jgi:hypothetical protein